MTMFVGEICKDSYWHSSKFYAVTKYKNRNLKDHENDTRRMEALFQK